jgi:putative transposase
MLPSQFVEQAYRQAGVAHNHGLYTPLVVLWLFIAQRLSGRASLRTAVLELLRGLPASFWPRPGQRIRRWRELGQAPSANTGAYNQARKALPLAVVEQSCDYIFQQLAAKLDDGASGGRVFVLDGSSIRMAHTSSLKRHYPPGTNQYGEGHWPLLRILVAHDLRTGLAMRPAWGAMHGSRAVSEQGLLETAIGRLPAGSTLIGDGNFGVFSVAWVASQSAHPVLLRLTQQRAQRMAGGELQDGTDRRILWRPSREDRKSHPELAAEASMEGRLIVRRMQPEDGKKSYLLALFTTLEGSADELLALYGQRWAIETDLRTLKSQLRLDQLTSTSPEMVAKEIDLAIAAYNLVRAMICLAAQESGIAPRGYSFTWVSNIVQTFGPMISNAQSPEQAQRYFDQMMTAIHQAKLYRRQRPSYPRALWRKRNDFPKRKS